MKLLITTACLLVINYISLAQTVHLKPSIRVSLQTDFQSATFADTQYPFTKKEFSTTQLNWGSDFLLGYEFNKNIHGEIGLGYFRNKFNFQRLFNHSLLNAGRDSVGIGLSTKSYTFHLLRIPIGFYYNLIKKDKYSFALGIDNFINISLREKYDGPKTFPEAHNARNKFKYYGNSIVLFAILEKKLGSFYKVEFQPYIRLLNSYQIENDILYEPNSKLITDTFDAIGLSLNFPLHFK